MRTLVNLIQNNKEHFRARKRRWRSKNPDKAAVIDSRKKARILEAMLPTTDEKLIEKIHRERRKLSKKDNKVTYSKKQK